MTRFFGIVALLVACGGRIDQEGDASVDGGFGKKDATKSEASFIDAGTTIDPICAAASTPSQGVCAQGLFGCNPVTNGGCDGGVGEACDISGQQQNLGASYVTSLKVQGVSCAKGEKVIKAYHQCRHQSGGAAGNCSGTVLGFSCKDGKRTGVPNVQYNATAKCHKLTNPSKRVKSRYTQND